MSKSYHIYQTSVWRGGGICEQKLTCNIKLHFRGSVGRVGSICEQKLQYNIKLQFGGVGVYMSKTIFSYTTWDTPYYRKNALKSRVLKTATIPFRYTLPRPFCTSY